MTPQGARRIYRKTKHTTVWHWCRNCSHWPTSEYIEQEGLPFTGELCYECKTRQESDSCQ